MADTIRCPYCPRQFGSRNALQNHVRAKRKVSAAHGLSDEKFPRTRKMIADAIEEAIFDAFGMEPPDDNSRPIRTAEHERGGSA